MFRTRISSSSSWPSFSLPFLTNITGTQAIASTFNHIHTSAVLCSQATKRIGARNKKINLLETEKRLKVAAENRPSVILGTRPNEEEKWKSCDLAKVLVNQAALVSSTELEPKDFAIGKVNVPKQFGFGVDAAEQKMLLNGLPLLTADMAQQGELNMTGYRKSKERQLQKANMFAKILDLRNANAAGIAYENRRRIIYAFSAKENSFDPGRVEVQGAQPDQAHQICLFAQFCYYSRSFDLQNSKSMVASHHVQTRCWQSTKSSAARSSKG